MRTDEHRRSVLVPANYVLVDAFDSDIQALCNSAIGLGVYSSAEATAALQAHIAHQRARQDEWRSRAVGDNRRLTQCSVCGAHLRYVCVWQHVDGGIITTGEDCADNIDVAQSGAAAEKVGALREISKAARERNKLAKELAEWIEAVPARSGLVEFLSANRIGNSFYDSLYRTLSRYAGLSERQEVALVKAIERDGSRAAEALAKALNPPPPSVHLGTVGEKLTVTGKITHKRGVESYYGYTTLVKLVTEDGSEVTTFSTARWVQTVSEGDTVTLTGTVKGHDDYRGRLQTKLTRVKLGAA